MLALIGAFLGFQSLPWVSFEGAALGSLAGLVLWERGEKDRRRPIPYGPFLAATALVFLIATDRLLAWMT